LLDTGRVRCWGNNASGQLGYGHLNAIGDDELPASAGDVDVGGTVVQLAAGAAHTCALLTTGSVRCWGGGGIILGYGNMDTIGDNEPPASAGDIELGDTAVHITAGWFHTCAVLSMGSVRCWGYGGFGILGYGNLDDIGDDETPASVGPVDVGGSVAQLAGGSDHMCALLDSGAVRCWGRGTFGELGYANTSDVGDDETPAVAGDVDVGGTAIQVSAGEFHSCAVMSTGAVRCWGLGSRGRLGYGNASSIGDDEVPSSAGSVQIF
jgi:alpha-tubulin suppressor-like RCC1 family protein